MNVPNTPARGPEEARAVPPGGPPITWGSEGGLWGSIGEHLPGEERPTVTSSEPVAGQRSDAENAVLGNTPEFLNAPARGRSAAQAAPVGAWSDEGGFDGSAGEHPPAEEREKVMDGSGTWNTADIQRRGAEFLWNTQRTFLDLIDGVTDPKQLMDMVMPGSPNDLVAKSVELVGMGMGDSLPDEAKRAMAGINAGMDALRPDEGKGAVPERTWQDDALRGFGLGTRGVMDGLLGLLDTAAIPIRVPVNYVNGRLGGDPNYIRPLAGTVPDAVGLPMPETDTETILYHVNSGLASLLPTLGVGLLAKAGQGASALPTWGKAIGEFLAAEPGAQVASTAASGLASGMAQNAGLGPWGQLGASVVGGLTGNKVGTVANMERGAARTIGQTPKEFGVAIRTRPQEARAAYRERFGNILDVDQARELCGDYGVSREGRIANTNTVHRAAGELINGVYDDILKEAPGPGRRNAITFTAGAGGAGKSTAITNNPALQDHINKSQAVLDTTLSSPGALKKVDQALNAGKDVDIFYVARDPLEAIVSTFRRAQQDGRYVPLKVVVEGHGKARENIREAFRRYAGEKRVQIYIVDNTRGGQQQLVNPALLDSLNYDNLLERARDALEKEYQHGRLSEDLYRRIID